MDGWMDAISHESQRRRQMHCSNDDDCGAGDLVHFIGAGKRPRLAGRIDTHTESVVALTVLRLPTIIAHTHLLQTGSRRVFGYLYPTA